MASSSALRSGIKNYARYLNVLSGTEPYVAPPEGAYDLIETVTLSSSQSSFTFSNLGTYSSTYKHFQIRGVGRSDRGDDNSGLNIRFNGDSGANYSWHNYQTLSGSFDFASSNSATSIGTGYTLAAATTNSNHFGGYVIDILDTYNTDKFITTRCLSGQPSGRDFVSFASGIWKNTASMTSITLLDGAGANMVSGTRFSLYGLRGS